MMQPQSSYCSVLRDQETCGHEHGLRRSSARFAVHVQRLDGADLETTPCAWTGRALCVTELLGGVGHALPLDERVQAAELVVRVRPRAEHRVAAGLDKVVGLEDAGAFRAEGVVDLLLRPHVVRALSLPALLVLAVRVLPMQLSVSGHRTQGSTRV